MDIEDIIGSVAVAVGLFAIVCYALDVITY